jgi:hypothetical protein
MPLGEPDGLLPFACHLCRKMPPVQYTKYVTEAAEAVLLLK